MAVCALGKDLTPEQQIAVSCAMDTDGVIPAYVVCVGGELTGREISKCLTGGIATEDGCYGPHNVFREFYDGLDDKLKQVFGENGEGYKLFHGYKEDFLTPGPNGKFIKFLNNGLSDMNNGPGRDNEFGQSRRCCGRWFQKHRDKFLV